MGRQKILELEKWGKGRLEVLAIFAHQVALGADAIHGLALMARKGELVSGEPAAKPPEGWDKLYEQADSALTDFARTLLFGGSEDESPEGFLRLFNEGAAELSSEEISELREQFRTMTPEKFQQSCRISTRVMENMYAGYLNDLAAEFSGHSGLSLEDESAWRERAVRPESLFFLKVALPCWIEYGENIGAVVSRAKTGSMGDIEKLIRLDKWALEVSWIRGPYYEAKAASQRVGGGWIDTALAGYPDHKLTRAKVKIALGAFIYKTFDDAHKAFNESWGKLGKLGKIWGRPKIRLKIPDVQRLFDAVARDRDGQRRDLDLPESPNTFQMALRRELTFWEKARSSLT